MKRWMLVAVVAILFSHTTYAEVPKLINYSGKIVDKDGVLLNTGDYDMWFSLWDAPTGGNRIWQEYHIVGSPSGGVHVTNGAYNLMLGSVDPIGNSLPMFSQNYYLQVAFHPTTGVPPYETFGRQQIVSVPYALQANDSLRANDGIPKGGILMWPGPTCPSGYRRMSELDNLFPRGSSSYSGGYAGGVDSHSHGGNTQLATTDHTHSVNFTSQESAVPADSGGAAQNGSGWYRMADVTGMIGRHSHAVIGTTSGVSAQHSHGITTDSNIPRYFNVIFCQKN
jgi:hypothetical protein